MSFYWVNVGASFKEVAEHRFLWAPAYTFNKNGKKSVDSGWKHVPDVKVGDVLFCHEDGRIIYVAIAKTDAYPSERPPSRAFDQWKNDGFKIEIDLEILGAPVSTKDFKDTLIRLYNERCSPKLFSTKNEATQNYMIALPDGAGAFVLDAVGEISLTIQDKISDSKGTSRTVKITEREAIVKSRVGQGKFREDVLALWGGICPVTGVEIPDLLIASHILPWQLSNDEERLDEFNGFPLSPSADKLFDRGYISFSNEGEILISEHIPHSIVESLGIQATTKLIGLCNKHKKYLERHREIFGFEGLSDTED